MGFLYFFLGMWFLGALCLIVKWVFVMWLDVGSCRFFDWNDFVLLLLHLGERKRKRSKWDFAEM